MRRTTLYLPTIFFCIFATFINGILIPSGGDNSCPCASSRPCPAPPSQPVCAPPSAAVPPCPCMALARSSKGTHIPTTATAIDITDERKLIALSSKDIRRHPSNIGRSVSSTPTPTNSEEIVRISGNSNSTEDLIVDGGRDDEKCNSQVFKKLMIDNINEESSNESKRAINAAAEQKFGGVIDVICSRGHFSYVYTSSLFCEATRAEMTCVAFRQVAE